MNASAFYRRHPALTVALALILVALTFAVATGADKIMAAIEAAIGGGQ